MNRFTRAVDVFHVTQINLSAILMYFINRY
jgi:hypothetical protein